MTYKKKLRRLYIPIWLQFFVATTGIVALTVVILGYIVFERQKEQLYHQTVKTGMVSLSYFTNNASIPLIEDNILRLNTLIKEAASVEGLLYVIIVDHKGVIKAHTDYHKIGTSFDANTLVESNDGKLTKGTKKGDVTYFKYTLASGEHVLALRQPITFKDKVLGDAIVGVSLDFLEDLVKKEKVSVIVMSSFIMLLGIAIAIFLGFGFSRPIKKLVVATQEVGKGNYGQKLNMRRNDELGNLADAFDYMSNELWTKSLMQESFGKYVGSEILDMILADPENPWLKGQKSEATVLFTDLRRFTAYSEAKEPEEVVEGLNKYFNIASNHILLHGGYIDKFLGDGVLAIFGVPVSCEDHVARAVRAAVAMQREIKELDEKGDELLSSMGVGINSGMVISGNIGSQVKMEYTVIGDTVNVASRLNGLAGPGEIIISESAYEKVADMVIGESLPPQKLKGKAESVRVFKVLGIKEKSGAGNEQ